MLRGLRVKDFAIIDEANVDFGNGFTVFTGETGAGKSILIDAISLITGGRASSDVVRDGSEEAVIEAIFDDINPPYVAEKMTRYGISTEGEEILIRRNISKSGKSRVYINGVLSTLLMLDDVCNGLVDIHGQHEHQSLLKKDLHIEYIDAFGKLLKPKTGVSKKYQYLLHIKNNLKKLEEDIRRKREKEDLIRFQLTEIKSAGLKAGEDLELSREKNILLNSKKLSLLSEEAYHLLYDNDGSVLSLLNRVEDNINEIAGIDSGMGVTKDIVTTSRINLKEVSELIRGFREDLIFDPERLEKIEERLYLIERSKKKYGPSIEDVLALQERLESELDAIEASDQNLNLLTNEIESVTKELELEAFELSILRKAAIMELEKEVMRELSQLHMGGMKFVVNIEKVPVSSNGIDSVEFLIGNMNEEPKPLVRVVSGGELSRLMLALKCCLSSIDNVHTLIFDEIDTGIGGRVAEEVGSRLKYLSGEHQVCCVTHLPQIAAKADTHYCVEKVLVDNRVVTRIKRLNEQERIHEIGRMLGGTDKTNTALKYAEEMIKRSADFRKQ